MKSEDFWGLMACLAMIFGITGFIGLCFYYSDMSDKVHVLANKVNGHPLWSRDCGWIIILRDGRVWYDPLNNPAPESTK